MGNEDDGQGHICFHRHRPVSAGAGVEEASGLDRAVVARGALLLSLTSFFILRGRGLPARRGV